MKLNLPLQTILKPIRRIFRLLLLGLGSILLLGIILSFTDYPFWAYYGLGTRNAGLKYDPDIIIVMGGGGMPSPDGLIRCYFAAETAAQFPDAFLIVAVPADTALKEDSPERLMSRELQLRGVDSSRIGFEPYGTNTRSQAVHIRNMLGDAACDSLALRIVTSPEHMYRSVAAFRKVGFRFVGGQSSFEKAIDEKLLVEREKVETDDPVPVRGLVFRYNMWNYLKYEIIVLREWCAIAYYKLRGWI